MKFLFRKLHQSWLFVALCLGIVVGTILALIFRPAFFASPIWIVFVLLLFIFAFFKPNYLFLIIIFLSGIILAFFRASADFAGENYIKQFVGQSIEISGIISEDPDIDENGTSLKLSSIIIGDQKIKGSVFVKLGGANLELERSDLVVLKGKVSEGFGSFAAFFSRPKIKSIAKPEPGDVFLKMRNWFAEQVRKFIPETESSLGLAYLLGMKNGLSDEVLDMLRIVGLTHIVVASGTHLGIIIAVVRKIFGRLSRFAGLLFSILFILIFGGIIGWTASITRAAIVTILSLLAWYVGRKFDGWRILLIAAAATLMINPMFITNLGWLLSFGSFAGILILMPEVKRFLFGEKKVKKIWGIILATISAQLLCIPILLYYFGTISLISVVANVLILPTIPFVMGTVFLTGVTAFSTFFGTIFGTVSKWILDYHLLIMKFFSEQKMFLISIEPENPLVFLIYIPIVLPFLILFIRRYLKKKRETKL